MGDMRLERGLGGLKGRGAEIPDLLWEKDFSLKQFDKAKYYCKLTE